MAIAFFSCDRTLNEKTAKVGWVKKTLCDHWVIQLPSGTALKRGPCINDLKFPGIIDFPNDSIRIEFYAFGPPDMQTKCDFDALVKRAKENSYGGACQGDGSIKYKISPYIDYPRKIAGTMGKAIDSLKYLTTLEIGDCSNWSLTLIFESLSPYYDNMATEIIKSVEFVKSVDDK
jgi:hypothetical protein